MSREVHVRFCENVEGRLLCVTRLVIIAAIAAIAVPIFINKSVTSKQIAHNKNVQMLIKQGNTYVIMEDISLPPEGDTIDMTSMLVQKGYIKQLPKYPLGDEDYVVKLDDIGKIIVTPGMVEVTGIAVSGGSTPPPSGEDNLPEEEEVEPEQEPLHEIQAPEGYASIYKIEELYNIRNTLTGSYILMAYLDFTQDSSYTNPNDTSFGDINGNGTTEGIKTELTTGAGWMPVGTSSTYFTGTFNGNGYKIENLYINRGSADYVGLFGNNKGTIRQIGLENASVTGRNYTGGLIGYNYGGGIIETCYATSNVSGASYVGGLAGYNGYSDVIIRNCYATGNVTATGSRVGGLVGYNYYYALVEKSYAVCNVSGTSSVGGLVGENSNVNNYYATIRNCYAGGNITGTGSNIGVVVGYQAGVFTNNYRLDTATGDGSYGTAATQAELQSETFTAYTVGWDLTTTWRLGENEYQKLGGTGTSLITTPQYQIYTIDDLCTMKLNMAGSYQLMNDIDFNNESDYSNVRIKTELTTEAGWMPVGGSTVAFTGTFNGNGYTIKNLHINRSSGDYVGLFGNNKGTIRQIGLENASVTGRNYTGGLIGYNYGGGIIETCYATSNVSGASYVGGLAGYNGYSDVIIRNCYATGNVTATGSRVGGLVGYNYYYALVEKSYAVCNVSGTSSVGGLVGENSNVNNYYATIRNCYAGGNITGTGSNIGVVVGYQAGVFTNNYRLDTATGDGSYGTAATQAELQSGTFLFNTLTWDITTIWQALADNWPELR